MNRLSRVVAAALSGVMLAAPSAAGASEWAYCFAYDKALKNYIVSAPLIVQMSSVNDTLADWKTVAQGRFGANLGRADCYWSYSESAAPQALQMYIDEQEGQGRQVEKTGWVWRLGGLQGG